MRLAAHQPQYLPYLGLLSKIAAADVFVLQDDLQFSRSSFQNRNRIRTSDGVRWLTIPVHAHGLPPLNRVMPADEGWLKRHGRIVAQEYHSSPHLDRADAIWDAVAPAAKDDLAAISARALGALLQAFAITTPVILESSLGLTEREYTTKDLRLQTLCRRFGADEYLSGLGGRVYMDLGSWSGAGIAVEWSRWSGTPYEQVHDGWSHNLSAIDGLLSVSDPTSLLESQTSRPTLAPAATTTPTEWGPSHAGTRG